MDTNANILRLVAAGQQVCCDKLGVTNGEVQAKLKEAVEKALERESASRQPAPSASDSGAGRSEVLSAEVQGANNGSPESDASTSKPESETGDDSAPLGEGSSGIGADTRVDAVAIRNEAEQITEYFCGACKTRLTTVRFDQEPVNLFPVKCHNCQVVNDG